jgi:hypothetical protein
MKFSDLGDKGPDFIREMDSQGYRGSRDSIEDDAGKKEYYGKVAKPGDVVKQGTKALDNAFNHKEDDWSAEFERRMKNEADEDLVDEASLAQMRDYFNQADTDSVRVDRNYDAPSKKQNPIGIPPEIQALVNKMYHAGKISPQEFEVLRKFQQKTKINVGIREADKNPYAIGMAQAMKSTGDKPPLKKSTINKAHEIARAIKKDQ